MAEKITFDLVPVENENKVLEIKNYSKLFNQATEYAKEVSSKFEVLSSDDDYKALKNARTELRAISKSVSDTRKNVNELIMATFNEQSKSIEKLLNDTDNDLKGRVEDYEKNVLHKAEKPKMVTMTIKLYNSPDGLKLVEKIKSFAKKLGVSVEIK